MRGMRVLGVAFLGAALVVSGCGRRAEQVSLTSSNAQECLARAMYFESNRSSRDGMVAVGSVVMNRVASPDFPGEVCAVVGQKGQFAPGVLSTEMREPGPRAMAMSLAASVLAGERHPQVTRARFFHQKDHRFPYRNMHYVVTAGGNAFYEKRPPAEVTQRVPLPQTEGVTGSGATAPAHPVRRPGLLARLFGR